MKIIFLAGYCTNYIIPLLPKDSEIICTHKEEVKPQKFDKFFDIKRLSIEKFMDKKEFFFKILNLF